MPRRGGGRYLLIDRILYLPLGLFYALVARALWSGELHRALRFHWIRLALLINPFRTLILFRRWAACRVNRMCLHYKHMNRCSIYSILPAETIR